MDWSTILLWTLIWMLCIFFVIYLLHIILDIRSTKKRIRKIEDEFVYIRIKKSEIQTIVNNLNAVNLAMRKNDE